MYFTEAPSFAALLCSNLLMLKLMRAALPLRVVCWAETLNPSCFSGPGVSLWASLSRACCWLSRPCCIYSLHVTTTNSHLVHRRHDDALVVVHDDDDDDDDSLLMGLVYQMPSTIMCTYQSYHDDTGQSDWLCFICLTPGINPEWS